MTPETTSPDAEKGIAMSSFDDRERAEEARYALDQETQFKVVARRNKLLGLWAAELMGLETGAAETYAKSVVIADLEEAGDGDVIRKVLADFAAAGVSQTAAAIEEQLARLTPVARDQIMKDIKA